jgi:hypothetical protein
MKTPTNGDWQITTCAGKQAFETAALANKVAKLSPQRRTTPMNAYKCTVCLKYHIGNRIGKTKAANKKPPRLDNDNELLR